MDRGASKVETILVAAPNWIGEQILAYSFFVELRSRYPESKIVSVCTPLVRSLQYLNLVDHVFVYSDERDGIRGLGRIWSTARRVREAFGPFDLAFVLPNSFRVAFFLKCTGAKNSVGYVGDFRSLLLTDRLRPVEGLHRSQSYLGLLNSKNVSYPDSGTDLSVFGWNLGAGIKLRSELPSSYIVVAPGAEAESRRWPEEYFLELMDLIWERLKKPTVLVGGPKEAALAERMTRGRERSVIDCVARTEVAALVPILKAADFVVSNDNGIAHLAAFSGARVKIPWGAGDPRRTLPLGSGKVAHRVEVVDCWPCEKNSCLHSDSRRNQCTRDLSVDSIWQLITQGEDE